MSTPDLTRRAFLGAVGAGAVVPLMPSLGPLASIAPPPTFRQYLTVAVPGPLAPELAKHLRARARHDEHKEWDF